MRILHIIGTLDPAAGGPTSLIETLAANAPEGVTFEAVTEDEQNAPYLQELPFPAHAFGQKKRRWFTPGMLPWLRSNRHRFDGILVHGLWEYGCLAARLAFAGRVPVFVFPHGMLDPYFARAHRARHCRKQLYWWLIAFWNLRSATRVLFTTRREEELAQRTFFPARWTASITPIGCSGPPGDAATLQQAFSRRWPPLRDKRFFLFLGRIDAKKGCDLLLKAFAELAHDHPDVHLMLAGPDPLKLQASLEAATYDPYAEGRIHWPGMLQGQAKWGALAACDAFVLPSHQENFGIAVAEALASGTAVLVSDQVNIVADIAAANAGLIAPDTLEGTRSLLTHWLDLPAAERHAMQDNARRLFLERYDMRRNTATLVDLFRREMSPALRVTQPATGSASV